MKNNLRAKLLKELGTSVQSRVSQKRPPKMVDSDELFLLWQKFFLSTHFKSVLTYIDKLPPLDFNYSVLICWLNFLDNFQIPHGVDVNSYIVEDLGLSIKSDMHRVLSNLTLYKVLPNFRVSNVSYRLHLPSTDEASKRLNSFYGPTVAVLLNMVPAKKNRINLNVKSGPKLSKATVDGLIKDKLENYLYTSMNEYLKYTKPLSESQLLGLPEYQWFYRKDSDLRFRNNGDSLAVLYLKQYQGLLPMSGSSWYLQNMDRFMTKALRVL